MTQPDPAGAFFPLKPGSKEPAIKAWQAVTPGTYPAEGNYGVALFPSVLVLDCDAHKGGLETLDKLLKDFPACWPTYTVKTPRNGFHLYGIKPVDFKVKKEQKAYPGIDFLSKGCYVCGPGTTTIQTTTSGAGTYEIYQEGVHLVWPEAFLQTLQIQASAIRRDDGTTTLSMLPVFKSEAQNEPGVTKGSRGSTALKIAMVGRDYGLPNDVVFEVLRDTWSPKCSPILEDAHLKQQVDRAFKYGKNTPGCKTPEAVFAEVANVVPINSIQAEATTTRDLDLTMTRGRYDNTLNNMIYFLSKHQDWRGRIYLNEFTKQVEVKNGEGKLEIMQPTLIRAWFSCAQPKLEVGVQILDDAIFMASTKYHPVKDYLESLRWDGKPRLNMLLPDTIGCESNEYTQEVGSTLLIAAIKRIYQPGCKQDYVMVLEHRQGTKKSTWVEALAGEWHSTGELIQGDKDTYLNLIGKWIVELPEIDVNFSRSDIAWIKKTLSTGSDTYRPPFERHSRAVPRESIFIATINPNVTGQYLRDEENRRYLPIRAGRIDIDLLKENRDQYFAEAFHRYKEGENSWLSDKQAVRLAKIEQDKRKERDPWIDALYGWVNADQQKNGFSGTEALSALGHVGKELKTTQRIRMYRCLRELGWEYYEEARKWHKPLDLSQYL